MEFETTAELIALAQTYDPRLAMDNQDQERGRIQAWADVLDDTDPEFALNYVRRFYRQMQAWPLQAGEIRQIWQAERTSWEHKRNVERTAAGPGQPERGHDFGEPELAPISDEARQGILDGISGTGDLAEHLTEIVSGMRTVTHYTFAQLAAERHCGTRHCPCPHDECWAGLADDVEVSRGQRIYVQTKRCRTCEDALELAR